MVFNVPSTALGHLWTNHTFKPLSHQFKTSVTQSKVKSWITALDTTQSTANNCHRTAMGRHRGHRTATADTRGHRTALGRPRGHRTALGRHRGSQYSHGQTLGVTGQQWVDTGSQGTTTGRHRGSAYSHG